MPEIQINGKQQNYIAAYCMHVHGILPWAVAAFLRYTFRGDPQMATITAADVCRLFLLWNTRRDEEKGISFRRWDRYRTNPDKETRDYLANMIKELHRFFERLPRQFSVMRLAHPGSGTILEQMQIGGLYPSLHQTVFPFPGEFVISYENTLFRAGVVEHNRQVLTDMCQARRLDEEHFLGFLCLFPDGKTTNGFQGQPITAFKIAMVRNALHLGDDTLWDDLTVFNFVQAIFDARSKSSIRELAQYQTLRKEVMVYSKPLSAHEQDTIIFFTNLYIITSMEIDLKIDVEPAWDRLRRHRNDMYDSHIRRLRDVPRSGTLDRLTIRQQMDDQKMFTKNYYLPARETAFLGPVALQKTAILEVIKNNPV
ncbi:MAG: hypothetical protein Q9222_003071 [Ikaeria aurantiellina]